MKYSRLLLGAVIAVMACSTALARIGETLEQCKERYGEPTLSTRPPPDWPEGSTMYGFEKSGMEIAVTIYESKAVQIMFRKLGKDEQGKPMALSEKEIETLLEASGQGEKWDAAPPQFVSPDQKGWYVKLDNGTLIMATLNKDNGFLTLITREFSTAIKESSKNQQSQSLEGF